MDLDSFLVSLFVFVDDWWQEHHPSSVRKKKPGRPALLSDPRGHHPGDPRPRPRFRSERDFWRFASAHLRPYFPMLCSQGQLNRRIRAGARDAGVAAVLRRGALGAFGTLPRDGHHPGAGDGEGEGFSQGALLRAATFGRSASKTEWVYGFKVALVVDPDGVVTAFGLAAASSDERPMGTPS